MIGGTESPGGLIKGDCGLPPLAPGLVSSSDSSPDENREDRGFMEGEDDVREEREEYEEADKLLVDLLA